jgi:CheY-like chemotaxis protein
VRALRVILIHWNEYELEGRTAHLRKAGCEVEAWHRLEGAGALRALGEEPPDAVVIDLSRIPSHGREVGVAIRARKTTRHLPLVFVEGAPEKVQRVRDILPDAVYASWRGIKGALKRAVTRPPEDPVRVDSNLAAYAKTPLPKKLGIKEGFVVALVGAPDGMEKTLGRLPKDVTLKPNARGRSDLTLWFVRSRKALDGRIAKMTGRAEKGGLWIVWPKKTSKLASDLTQAVVREVGLAAGLVDFKVCRVDETWAGLRFTKR